MNTNELQTIKARKIAKACESITAEDFLSRFDHLLMLAMRMAEATSQRDIANPIAPAVSAIWQWKIKRRGKCSLTPSTVLVTP